MSATKIKYYEANAIGQLIAAKAFEHLIDPHEAAVSNFTAIQYDHIVRNIIGIGNIAKLVKVGVLREENCCINFVGDGDNHVQYHEGDNVVCPMGYNNSFELHDQVAYDEFVRLSTPLWELKKKRNALAAELRAQINGKSAKAAMKAWPEAAEIIASYFQISATGKDISMTSPLEQLLAKYLPLLAAPQGA